MEPTIDRLIRVRDRRKAEILATLSQGRWESKAKKVELVTLSQDLPDTSCTLWWAHGKGKEVEPLQPATQAIEFGKSKQWNQVFSNRGCVIGGLPGPAVIVVRQGEDKRWFGIVKLVKQGREVDPKILDDATAELEPWAGGLVCQKILPPEFLPKPMPNGLRLDSAGDIDSFLMQTLHPEVLRQVEEIGRRLPALQTRLDIEHSLGNSFQDDFVELLLTYPVFRTRFEVERDRVRLEAEGLLSQAKSERDSLEAEISLLRQRKLDQIRLALEDLVDDERVLALATIFGRQKATPPLDVSSIVAVLQDLSQRPLPSPIDTEVIAHAISNHPALDISPLVTEIACLREDLQLRNRPLLTNREPDPRIDTGTCRQLDNSQDLNDLELVPAQISLLTIAHSELLPIACGPLAEESVHRLLQCVVADRATWWHCPSNASDSTCLFLCQRVTGTIYRARENPKQLFAIVLEGIDRAPTEAYLEPLLTRRALGLPIGNDEAPWPTNLLLFATVSCGGQTVLSISPGTWRRAIPVIAATRRAPEITEIAQSFWSSSSSSQMEITLDGLLPGGVKPLNVNKLGMSATHLEVGDTGLLGQGIAVASCLARGDGTKPIGGFPGFGRLLA